MSDQNGNYPGFGDDNQTTPTLPEHWIGFDLGVYPNGNNQNRKKKKGGNGGGTALAVLIFIILLICALNC